MSTTNKMDTSAVFEMFETISNKLDKKEDKSPEPIEIDLSAVNTMTEKLEAVIEEVRKPAKVEHQHCHTIDINSNWVFDEDNLYRLEQQFKYNDSIKIIRKQVEKYEKLVREQAEKLARMKRDSDEAEQLRKEAETVKGK